MKLLFHDSLIFRETLDLIRGTLKVILHHSIQLINQYFLILSFDINFYKLLILK